MSFQKLILLAGIILATLFVIDYATAQTVDTVITTPIYKSYFCKKYKEPLYVIYKIYKAPLKAEYSRAGLSFKNDIEGLETNTRKDYAGSNYDEGHMAPCEDFSNSEKKMEETFRFYNCLPQTPNLNRGIWKKYEDSVRIWSQTDSLLIICGGGEYVKNGNLYAPTYCYKIIYNLPLHNPYTKVDKPFRSLFFSNSNDAWGEELSATLIADKIGYIIKY